MIAALLVSLTVQLAYGQQHPPLEQVPGERGRYVLDDDGSQSTNLPTTPTPAPSGRTIPESTPMMPRQPSPAELRQQQWAKEREENRVREQQEQQQREDDYRRRMKEDDERREQDWKRVRAQNDEDARRNRLLREQEEQRKKDAEKAGLAMEKFLAEQPTTDANQNLVLFPFLDRSNAINVIEARAGGTEMGTLHGRRQTFKKYDAFADAEKRYYNKRIQDGREVIGSLGNEHRNKLKAVDAAGSEMDQLLGEFGAPAPDVTIQESSTVPPSIAQQMNSVQTKIDRITPYSQQEALLKELAQIGLSSARDAAIGNEMSDAQWYLSIAEGAADIALGIDPITGFYRGLVESVSGYNVVTGAQLSGIERSFAVFAVITGGTSASALKTIKLLGRLGHYAGSPALRIAERMIHSAQAAGQNMPKYFQALRKVGEHGRDLVNFPRKAEYLEDIGRAIEKKFPTINITEFHTAEELNQMTVGTDRLRPYIAHSYGISGTLKNETKFYRFSEVAEMSGSGSKPIGGWLALPSDFDLNKMSPEDVRMALSLEHPPKFVTDVMLPGGTPLQVSQTSAIFGGTGNTAQYQIEIRYQRPEYFSPNPRAL